MTARAGRVVDTGRRSGPENIRLDRAQWREACESEAPACHVRFHRYLPSVSLGALETADQAARGEYCRRRGIDVVQRVSGGGAIYLDPDQWCWALTLSHPDAWRKTRLADWLARLCQGVVQGLRQLDIDAVFVPPNDIEVAGRKLAAGFLALSDSALLFQGSILFDLDTETMMKALRVPTEKLSPDGIRSARHRFATLRDLGVSVETSTIEQHMLSGWAQQLDVVFGRTIDLARETMPDIADIPVTVADWDGETGSWHQAVVKTPGGILHIRLRLSDDGNILRQVEFAGSVHAYPANLFTLLSSRLVGTPLTWLDGRFDDFFRTYPHDLLGFTAEDIRRGLYLALDRHAQQRQFALTREQANTLMVHAPPLEAATARGASSFGGGGRATQSNVVSSNGYLPTSEKASLWQGVAAVIARAASVMLVPYCAKPAWCKWRHRDGCPECGMCEVGEAYRLARERGMRVVTIVNFEHLEQTLEELRAQGTQAYVGMCCRHFYLKREYAFREAGIPAVLMDITGANCYDLQQEDLAYAGKFQAEARLNLDVLRKVMQRVPPVIGPAD